MEYKIHARKKKATTHLTCNILFYKYEMYVLNILLYTLILHIIMYVFMSLFFVQ